MLSIPERVSRFLPTETAQPAASDLVPVGGVDDEAPADVDVGTGEIIEGSFAEEDEEPSDGAPEDERQSAPVDPAALEAASEFVKQVAEENDTTYEGVLDTWNADIFGVAADLDGYRQRYEQRKARRSAKATAGAAS